MLRVFNLLLNNLFVNAPSRKTGIVGRMFRLVPRRGATVLKLGGRLANRNLVLHFRKCRVAPMVDSC